MNPTESLASLALTGDLRLRIVVEHPVPGVALQVQRGRDGLLAPDQVSQTALTFVFSVRLGPSAGAPGLRFLGEFSQGPAGRRFVYLCCGKRAGQPASIWDRRAKIALWTITPDQARAALESDRLVLEARVAGRAKDGGPLCASVPLLGPGWVLK